MERLIRECLIIAEKRVSKKSDAQMFSSAQSCMNDAWHQFRKGQYYYALMRCIRAIEYTWGIGDDYLAVLRNLAKEFR